MLLKIVTWYFKTGKYVITLIIMSPRTRPNSSPRIPSAKEFNVNDEENDKNISTTSASKTKRSDKFNRYIKLVALLLLGFCLLCLSFFLGTLSEKSLGNKKIKTELTVNQKQRRLQVHWAGSKIELSVDGDEDNDACILLSQCFKSKPFAPDPINSPRNPLQECYKSLRSILKSFDSGFYFEGTRLVGFISSGINTNNESFNQISLYNVCVRKENRGMGVAKAMLPEFLKEVLGKRGGGSVKKTFVGLDVNFETESAVSAFALYAKLGFNRWWEPCETIGEFDFNKINRQITLANPEQEATKPVLLFPASQFFLRREKTLQTEILDAKKAVLSHFCMVMVMGEDDFGSIGADIKKSVQEASKKS